MSLKAFPQSFKRSLAAAIEAAANGSKRDAGHAHIASTIGTPIIRLYKGTALVGTGTYTAALSSNTSTHKLVVGGATITLTQSIAPTDTLTFEILKADGSVGLRGSFPADATLSGPVSIESPPPAPGTLVYTIDDLVYEMTGVDDEDFGAVVGNPNWGQRLYDGYTHDQYPGGANNVFPWYEFGPPHPNVSPWTASAPNSRADIRNLLAYQLVNGVWTLRLSRTGTTGWWGANFYNKDSYSNAQRTLNPVTTSDGIGQPCNEMGFNGNNWIWHGFPDGMASSTGSIAEVWAICLDAKKSLINPNGVDDRSNARILGHVASDWYNGGTWVSEQMHARYKWLTNEWQRFGVVNMTVSKYNRTFTGALTEAQLRANPPPFCTT